MASISVYTTSADDTARAGKVDKGSLLLNVSDYGSIGTGDDAVAINAAILDASSKGGGTVYMPWRQAGYSAGAIVLKSGVTLRGDRRVKLTRTGASSVVFINATGVSNVGIEGLSIDPAGLVSAATIRMSTNTVGLTVRDCDITDSAQPTGVYALDTQAGTSKLVVESCDFHGMGNNIRLQSGVQDVYIRRNRFTQWRERCIYVLGTATYFCTDVTLEHNRFTDMAAGGSVRQPVAIQGVNGAPHQRVALLYNVAVGTSTAVNDTTTPGTADLLSLQHCVDFQVIGNRSIGSGDVGITIAEQSTRGVVMGNVVRGANSCGIAIGAGTTTDVGHLTITGNTLMNNGVNAVGDRTANRGGVWMRNAHSVVCGDNVMGDDQATKTQQSGYILLNCDNIVLGVDVNAGLAAGMVDTSGGSVTNSTKATTAALA